MMQLSPLKRPAYKRTRAILSATSLVAMMLVSNLSSAQALSSAEAADIARERTGGKVLSVKSNDTGYRVKVLMSGGQVKMITIKNNSSNGE